MSYFITLFVVVFIFYCISDHIGNGDCVEIPFESLCESSSVITLTWGMMQGHATSDNGSRIVITDPFPTCIAKAAKYGFVPTTNSDNMVTLVKNKF